MRALTALLVVLAATVTVTACSGPGPAGHGRPRIAPPASPLIVRCDQIIQQAGQPGGRLVLGVLAVPPARLEQAAAPTAARPWAYFAKWGIAIRAGSPAVLITVPEAWRHRAGISWGNNLGVVSSLRLLSCPRQLGAWNAYAGGFYLRSPSGCVPLVFHIGRQTAALSFAIGSGNCGMLEPGEQLPTAQQVVAKLAINPNTVHKAYRELERAGLARARPGLGTFITRSPSGTDPATQARFLAAMTDWLRSARSAGLGPDDIEAIYRTAFRTCFAEGVA